jgi:hypothetical protein
MVIRPVTPTSIRSRQTGHVGSSLELVVGVVTAVVALVLVLVPVGTGLVTEELLSFPRPNVGKGNVKGGVVVCLTSIDFTCTTWQISS